jgi:hypothetical protein
MAQHNPGSLAYLVVVLCGIVVAFTSALFVIPA